MVDGKRHGSEALKASVHPQGCFQKYIGALYEPCPPGADTAQPQKKIAFSGPSDLTLDRLSDWILTLK